MSVTSGLVLYAVIWFVTMLVMLPIGLRTQGDDGEVVLGTNPGAPNNYNPKKKAIHVTIVAAIVWLIAFGLIFSGWFSWEDWDWTQRLSA